MKTKKGFAFLLAAALLLTACGKTDNASQADAPPPAETQDSAQTGETPPSPAENAESALTPTESADSSSVSENDNYVIETHGSREYDGAAASDDFADALFIGDSRTVGLMLNGDKPKADYFATAGLNVMTAQTTPVVPKKDFAEFLTEQAYTDYGWGDDTWGGDTWTDYGWDDGGWTGGDSTQWDWGYTDPAAEPDSSEDTSSAEEDLMTIPEALKFKQYKRIFLNFGVNELVRREVQAADIAGSLGSAGRADIRGVHAAGVLPCILHRHLLHHRQRGQLQRELRPPRRRGDQLHLHGREPVLP